MVHMLKKAKKNKISQHNLQCRYVWYVFRDKHYYKPQQLELETIPVQTQSSLKGHIHLKLSPPFRTFNDHSPLIRSSTRQLFIEFYENSFFKEGGAPPLRARQWGGVGLLWRRRRRGAKRRRRPSICSESSPSHTATSTVPRMLPRPITCIC